MGSPWRRAVQAADRHPAFALPTWSGKRGHKETLPSLGQLSLPASRNRAPQATPCPLLTITFRLTFRGNEVRWAGLLEEDISPATKQPPWAGEATLVCPYLKHPSAELHRGNNSTPLRPTWLLLGPKEECLIAPLFPSASPRSRRAGAPHGGAWGCPGGPCGLRVGERIARCHCAACLWLRLTAIPRHSYSFYQLLLWKVKPATHGFAGVFLKGGSCSCLSKMHPTIPTGLSKNIWKTRLSTILTAGLLAKKKKALLFSQCKHNLFLQPRPALQTIRQLLPFLIRSAACFLDLQD